MSRTISGSCCFQEHEDRGGGQQGEDGGAAPVTPSGAPDAVRSIAVARRTRLRFRTSCNVRLITRARQRSALGNDRFIDVCTVSGETVPDFPAMGAFPGQGHRSTGDTIIARMTAGLLAPLGATLGCVHAFQVNRWAGTDNGVSVDYAGGTDDDQIGRPMGVAVSRRWQ